MPCLLLGSCNPSIKGFVLISQGFGGALVVRGEACIGRGGTNCQRTRMRGDGI